MGGAGGALGAAAGGARPDAGRGRDDRSDDVEIARHRPEGHQRVPSARSSATDDPGCTVGPSNSELRSPVTLLIWTWTSPAGASRPSPLTVSIANGPGPAKRPAIRMSPLVVAAWTLDRVAARISMSPETVRVVSSVVPVATTSTSPETASTLTLPLTARSVMSPDAVR